MTYLINTLINTGYQWTSSQRSLEKDFDDFTVFIHASEFNSTFSASLHEEWGNLDEETKEALLSVVKACFDSVLEELAISEIVAYDLSLRRRVGHGMLRKAGMDFLKKCMEDDRFQHVFCSNGDFKMVKVSIISKLLRSNFCDVRQSMLKWLAAKSKTEIENPSLIRLLQQRLLWHEEEAECLAEVC